MLSAEFSVPQIWLIMVPVVCFMESVKTVNLLIYRVEKNAIGYAIYSFSNTFLNLILALVFVVLLKLNYVGRLYSQYAVCIIYFLVGLYTLQKQGFLVKGIKKPLIKDVLKYGLPMIPHAIGFVIINLADRIFISKIAGNDELGIYSLAYNLGSVILMIALAFNNAWVPNFLELLKENTAQSKERVVKITYVYLLVLFGLTLGLSLTSPLIFRWFINEKFHDGLKLIPWISFSCFFFGCYLAFTNYISYLKKTKVFAYISIINIVFNLVLNYVLIHKFGILGAAYATFISFFLFALVVASIAIKMYPMPWLSPRLQK
ncbi:probable lipopolysaccharide biosynthesis protein [Pedobacter sp. BAL39]|nr:probable lipopolysaccharide biosynthesis protein [Pedobacter sp. BAL39]